jgi:hypothetical protein
MEGAAGKLYASVVLLSAAVEGGNHDARPSQGIQSLRVCLIFGSFDVFITSP